ncbi:YceI family protein [Flagellimonas pacifica]|uniref:Polyisoprenoid-binding protein YceI n=1 Tax=Flagellimonas pacifica TaxID=1247520 RepID=A0A285MS22_9FLAO|nr:YceI family protein [Allomuricauda parva]SNY99992.1 Polyisoprenoid-binding protein YceI [Allomuricauda parva]
MIKVFSFFLVLSIGLSHQNVLAQEARIAKAEISFEFVSKKVNGTITGFESTSSIDWEHPENSLLQGSVLSKTLDTNNGLRNWSLRSGKYFDVDDYPRITFKSKQIIVKDEKWIVKGNLVIKETTKPITITFIRKQNQLIGTTELYSIDYGIKIKKKREDNLVKIKMMFDIE